MKSVRVILVRFPHGAKPAASSRAAFTLFRPSRRGNRAVLIQNPKSRIQNRVSGPGSRTRPSDWGSNARFGAVEDRRNNRRLATLTCTLRVLQIWWLLPLTSPAAGRAAGMGLDSRASVACSCSRLRPGIPHFAIGVDIPSGGGRVDRVVMAAEFLVEEQCLGVETEIQ